MTSDNTTTVVEQNNETKPADSETIEKQSADTGNVNPDSVPYARFNELSKDRKKLQAEIDAMKAQQEEARLARMEEEGKTKELYSEVKAENKTLKEQNAYYKNLEQQERDGLLAQLPDDERDIYGDLSTTKLRAHVSKMRKAQSVNTDKSSAMRGNSLGIKHDSDIWNMNPKDRKKSWGDIVSHFKNKKK